jgi:amino acid transporter
MSTEKPMSGLVRSLSLLDITMVGIASMIGGAIFVLVGPAMSQAGPSLMIAFLINGLITVFTALTYAELGSAIPEAGGGYKWIREGLPRPNAFISGWMSWFAHMIAGSLYAVAFGSFFGHLMVKAGVPDGYSGFPLEKIIAVVAIVLFTYINIKGVSGTGKIGNAITISQLVIIFSLIIAGIIAMTFSHYGWQNNFQDFFPNGSIGIVIAMGLTFIAFEGYEIIVQTGEEVKNPKKNIPRAIFISLGVVTTLYVVFTFVFIGGLNPTEIGKSAWKFIGDYGALGIVESAKYLLPFGALIVLVGGIVSTLSALNAVTFSSSRVAFAMGRQYNLPEIFSSIHAKYHTPHLAIIVSGFIMLIFAILLPLEQIALVASVMFLFLFAQVNMAAITIRRLYGKKLDYGFKTPFFPIIPLAGIFANLGLSIYLLIYNPLSWLIAIIWIIIGFSVYKIYTIKKELEHYAPLISSEGPQERKEYRIMIVFNKKTIDKLEKIAQAISKEKDGEIVFLNVVTVPIQIPLSLASGFAEPATKSFEDLKIFLPQSIQYRYLVRLSHDTTEAILATVEEQGINLLLMDFYDLRSNRKLLSLTTCDILGVNIKKTFDEELGNVVVSYDKGRHSNLGLEIANSLSKSLNSKIRIVRGVVESPEEERDILSRINEMMFDLDLKKIPVERVYPTTEDITQDLLHTLNEKPEIVIVGAGNQSDQAFSPKTIGIVEKSKYSVFVVRNSRLSGIQARYFWHMIAPRLKENKFIYNMYIETMKLMAFVRTKKQPRSDEDYFAPKM